MSLSLMTLIWSREFSSASEKSIALKLADHADDDGCGIYPSHESLSADTGLSIPTVRRVLKRFIEIGLLVKVREGGRGPGNPNEYDFNLAELDQIPLHEIAILRVERSRKRAQNKVITVSTLSKKGDHCDSKGDHCDSKGDHHDHQTVREPPLTNNSLRSLERESENAIVLASERAPQKTQKQKRGTRLSEDWQVRQDDVSFAREYGFTDVQILAIATKFKNHWLSTTKNATKLDWHRTWQNWVITEAERKPAQNRGGRSSPNVRSNGQAYDMDVIARRAAEHERQGR